MKGHLKTPVPSRRARSGRGLTLVELLVTIVLSGLFFAAMVPVFVLASQQGQTDRARVLATNAAQSAIEVLRDLPYDDLYETDWSLESNVTRVGDPQWKGSGCGLDVGVTPYPLGSPKGQERYLLVSARAWWATPGGAIRDVTLKTAVYRQGLGTHSLLLYAWPLQSGLIKSVPVNVTARIDAGDASRTERIDFEVWANNGTAVANWSVSTSDKGDGTPSAELRSDGYYYYESSWAAAGVPDGTYTFVAKTVPLDPDDPDYDGSWTRKQYVIDLVQPGVPTVESCTPGFQPEYPGGPLRASVALSWTLETNIGDVGHIEIMRAESGSSGLVSPTTLLIRSKTAQTYVDRGVEAGKTYVYKVLVEDAQGARGEWSDPAQCTVPASPVGSVPQPPPSPVSFSVTGRSVTLRWGPSPSKLVVDEYRVYRDVAMSLYFAGRLPSTYAPLVGVFAGRDPSPPSYYEYIDPTVEYGGTYSYFVTAVTYDAENHVMWESVSASSGLVQIPQPPVLSMRISLAVAGLAPGATQPESARVVIHSLDTGAMIPANPWEYPTLKFVGSQKEWDTAAKHPFKADLYQGSYEVIAMFYSKNGQRLGTYVEHVDLVTTATPVVVTYRGPN